MSLFNNCFGSAATSTKSLEKDSRDSEPQDRHMKKNTWPISIITMKSAAAPQNQRTYITLCINFIHLMKATNHSPIPSGDE